MLAQQVSLRSLFRAFALPLLPIAALCADCSGQFSSGFDFVLPPTDVSACPVYIPTAKAKNKNNEPRIPVPVINWDHIPDNGEGEALEKGCNDGYGACFDARRVRRVASLWRASCNTLRGVSWADKRADKNICPLVSDQLQTSLQISLIQISFKLNTDQTQTRYRSE